MKKSLRYKKERSSLEFLKSVIPFWSSNFSQNVLFRLFSNFHVKLLKTATNFITNFLTFADSTVLFFTSTNSISCDSHNWKLALSEFVGKSSHDSY